MITNAALVMVHLTGIEPALLSEIEPNGNVTLLEYFSVKIFY